MRTAKLANEATGRLAGRAILIYENASWSNWPDLTRPQLAGFDLSTEAWLRAIADQRSHDEYESRMKLYVRPTFDRTPLVKITKTKLLELRTALREREDPLSPATINTLCASLSAAFSFFIEQNWCGENPMKLIDNLDVTERPFVWLQSAGDVQKLLSACNDNIRTLVAVLVGTGMRLDEALHLMWVDIDLAHRVIRDPRPSRPARCPEPPVPG